MKGRNKIPIKRITNERARQATFLKRKSGLMKKAMELSILCDCDIALTLISNNKKIFQYCSLSPDKFRLRYEEHCPSNLRVLSNDDYEKLFGNEKADIDGDIRDDGDSLIPPLPHFTTTNPLDCRIDTTEERHEKEPPQKKDIIPPYYPPPPLPPPSIGLSVNVPMDEGSFALPTNRPADERLTKKRKMLNLTIPTQDSFTKRIPPVVNQPSSHSSSSSHLGASNTNEVAVDSFLLGEQSSIANLDCGEGSFPFSPLTPSVFSNSFLIPSTPFDLNTPSLRSGWWMPSPLHPQFYDQNKSPPIGDPPDDAKNNNASGAASED